MSTDLIAIVKVDVLRQRWTADFCLPSAIIASSTENTTHGYSWPLENYGRFILSNRVSHGTLDNLRRSKAGHQWTMGDQMMQCGIVSSFQCQECQIRDPENWNSNRLP